MAFAAEESISPCFDGTFGLCYTIMPEIGESTGFSAKARILIARLAPQVKFLRKM